MPIPAPLRVVELLSARLCHDLISPVAAIANGAELLGEDDPDFAREAVTLVGNSAREANARLQFFRFAYGFGGGGLAGPAPYQLAAEYFAGSAVKCDYGEAARALPLVQQKLVCAMLLVAGEALPRGGRLAARAASGGPEIDAVGDAISLSEETRAALTRAADPAELTTKTVTAYFAGLLAAAQGRILVVSDRAGGFGLGAPPP
jgi:histidine phosphotransferase ChpT